MGLRIDYETNPEKPSNTDLILKIIFPSSLYFCVIETGLPDFHKMAFAVLKPKTTYCGNYKMFNKFREELLSKLSIENISNTSNGLETFLQILVDVQDKIAPPKKKYIRDKDISFMN